MRWRGSKPVGSDAMWVEVELLTRDRQFVTKVVIPRLTPPAEVVLWGSRIFLNTPHGYVEGIAVIPFDEVRP